MTAVLEGGYRPVVVHAVNVGEGGLEGGDLRYMVRTRGFNKVTNSPVAVRESASFFDC